MDHGGEQNDFCTGDLPLFVIGQKVRHLRYGYRGVIVDFDMSCQADEAWYRANQSQPDRQQPWYHVLVHNSTSVTYAAQTSLTADTTIQPISHPMIDRFFESFDPRRHRYQRNDELWPAMW